MGTTAPNRHRMGVVVVVVTLVLGVTTVAAGSAAGGGGAPSGRPDRPVGKLQAKVDRKVRLNQIQVIGSHNSYHELPPPAEVALRRSAIGDEEDKLQYRHAPLAEQFQSQGVRQIELDAFVDQAGGRYANPLLRAATGGGPYDPLMLQPGIKVLHVQDVDYHSTCLTLKICLGQVKAWSDANPGHVPLAVLLELKDDPLVVGDLQFVVPEPWTAEAMDALDAEIRSVFPDEQMITPDDVRRRADTLEEAVLERGWPKLREARGKVMFLMDNGGAERAAYLEGHPTLEGRVLFTNSTPGQPDAAFVKVNDPLTSGAEITDLVRRGYVVRTRADSETLQARVNDTSMRDAALASGAQWVSTDYPVPDHGVGFDTSYVAAIPGGTVARCNPVNAPRRCVSSVLDLASAPVP